jgi:hypothetical protein
MKFPIMLFSLASCYFRHLEKNDTEKTKNMLLSRHQNTGQNHDIKIADRCFENVAKFRYSGNNYNKSKPDSGGN